MITWQIHIEGQVQGVGFRPFAFSLAQELGVKGWVKNTIDGVHIKFNADEDLAYEFKEKLLHRAPRLSKIRTIKLVEVQGELFEIFQIIQSSDSGGSGVIITPDFSICKDCKMEVHDPSNRRQRYPFVTCTNCGPRYSIIARAPYDRERTTMAKFQMCPNCNTEYENPHDRRFASQTNSCPNCSIELSLYDQNQQLINKDQHSIISEVLRYWKDGKIVAIKGLGGYQLTCDASNPDAVLELRKRKHRPTKPLAIMVHETYNLNDHVVIRDSEKKALESTVAPIVLFNVKTTNESTILRNIIAPNNNDLGVMLPNTPLYELLLQEFKRPIIATSGNLSKAPISFKDNAALNHLSRIADYVLTNNREITVSQDDSIVKYSFFTNQRILLRRSRGLAPTFIQKALKTTEKKVLALGAMMKSTFSILDERNIYVSQYLGDLAHFDCEENYKYTITHFLKLLSFKPEFILMDKHKSYPSSSYGLQLATAEKLETGSIQHHIAHFAAVLGEHELIKSKEPILGIIWDGTGLGDDGQIWGGEFIKYEQYRFERCHHLGYFDFVLGDKMAREPRISALSACWEVEGAVELMKDKFTPVEWNVYTKLLEDENDLKTSSMGRIFDAVASLLGILDQQSYEGEAAMYVEALALNYFKSNGLTFAEDYIIDEDVTISLSTKSLMKGIIIDVNKGASKAYIAAKFHLSLVKIIRIVGEKEGIRKLAFSGGVFQNALLVDLIRHHLEEKFDLFFHLELAPNDENISFGQIVAYQIQRSTFTQ